MAPKPRRARSRTTDAGPPDGKDYVAIAVAYAKEAASERNKARFGKWVRLAARRFLADMVRARKRGNGFRFDRWHACDACDFIEKLPHVEGNWGRATIVLHPAQVFFVVNVFGFRRLDGTRRFTTAIFCVARKNAKSTLAAAILLYCLFCEGEIGPQVISAATTGDQARIVFNVAKRMVERTPALWMAFGASAFANAIACINNGGSFKPINAKASTQDGLNPSALCFDELHAHKTRDLFDVLRSAAGARANPLFLYTTTEGYENPGPWAEVRHLAFQVLQGVVEADHLLALYYAIDEADDDFDERAWIKANPLLGVSVSLEKLREYAAEARALPGALAEFRIKRCNRRSASADCWIDIPRWNACTGLVDLEALHNVPCYAGLDLSSTRDMTAFRLVWRLELGDGWCRWLTWGLYWVPANRVHQRTERGAASYEPWIQAGHVIETDGDVTDYGVVENAIDELRSRFDIRLIAYDSWNARDLVNRLMERNAPMIEFVQGGKSYHPAMQELERAYVSGNLAHGGDPVLAWNASNLVARRDPNMNMSPDRKRSPEKIDGMCALLMAIGAALGEQASEPYITVLD